MDEPWRRPCEKFRECMDPQPREKKKKEMEEMDKLIGSDVVYVNRERLKYHLVIIYLCVCQQPNSHLECCWCNLHIGGLMVRYVVHTHTRRMIQHNVTSHKTRAAGPVYADCIIRFTAREVLAPSFDLPNPFRDDWDGIEIRNEDLIMLKNRTFSSWEMRFHFQWKSNRRKKKHLRNNCLV